MNVPCNVILDLIPLVKDGIASEESIVLVDDHMKMCEACKAELEGYKIIKANQVNLKDKKIISAIKRSVLVTQIVILTIGAVIGIALSDSMGMMYNLLIMPFIGGVSYLSFKRKWYIAPIVVFSISYFWKAIFRFMEFGVFDFPSGEYELYFSSLYTFLVGVGVIIAMLLKYAFKKER